MEIKTKTGQNLKDMLIELYQYYFKLAKKANRGRMNVKVYNVGFYDGALEMIDTILFSVYGGKEAFENWVKNSGDDADETVVAAMKYGYMNGDDKETGS